MDDINKKAYQLLELLEEDKQVNHESSSDNIIGVPCIMTLDNVQNYKKLRGDEKGNTISVFANVEGNMIGFNETNYRALRELAASIVLIDSVNKYADAEFIEGTIFDWVIETYKQKRASVDLLGEIYNRIDEELKEYVFYFKVHACGIEDTFQVGNVTIGHLTSDKLAAEFKNFVKGGKTQEEFDAFFEEFRNVVLAIYRAKAVKRKAEKIARREVGLALDVVKSFLIEESLAPHIQIPDVDFRFSEIDFSSSLVESTNQEFDFEALLSRRQGVPVVLDGKKLKALKQIGFDSMSRFLTRPRLNESDWVVIRAIGSLGEIASTVDLYERVTKIVSLFEVVLIPEGSAKAKGHTLLKKQVIPRLINDSSRHEYYFRLINKLYEIRDKYLHNGLELPLDLYELFDIQALAFRFVQRLVTISNSVKSLNEIQGYFAKGAQQGSERT
ncbi:MAG: hypothetical protein ACOYXT_29130 [Bacteroidota bacterium]